MVILNKIQDNGKEGWDQEVLGAAVTFWLLTLGVPAVTCPENVHLDVVRFLKCLSAQDWVQQRGNRCESVQTATGSLTYSECFLGHTHESVIPSKMTA